MNINIDNYEIWFLDYTEGNLDESQKQELFAFLDGHPDLKNELDEFEIIEIDQFDTKFPNKNLLKKNPTYSSDDFIAYHEGDLSNSQKEELEKYLATNTVAKKEFEQLAKMYLQANKNVVFPKKDLLKSEYIQLDKDQLIAYHEGDLNREQEKLVLALIANNTIAKKEFDQIAQLYLSPDAKVIFPNKAALKKKETLIIPLFIRYAVVAASLLLVISLFFLNDNQDYKPRVAVAVNNDTSNPLFENEQEDSLGIPFKTNTTNRKSILADEVNPRILHDNPSGVNAKVPNQKITIDYSNKGNAIALDNVENGNPAKSNPTSLELKEINTLEVAYKLPKTLSGYKKLPVYDFPTMEDNNVAETTDKEIEQSDNNRSTTLLAFVEEKAAEVVTGEKKKKLRLFDVIKKVGDKSNLYDLNEKEDNKFTFKVLNMEMEGKRKKISL